MNEKLNAIANKAAQDFLALVKESEDNILEAWNAAEADAQENETTPKFALGFSVTLDLNANQMDSKLAFGIKRKLTITGEIPDPNQETLPLGADGESIVTIKTEGVEPLTMTAKQFSKAAKKLAQRN